MRGLRSSARHGGSPAPRDEIWRPLREHAVLDPAATVTRDVERLRFAPSISSRVTVSGRVYDVVTGLVEPVLPAGR